MKKLQFKRMLVKVATVAAALALGLAFTGCPDPSSGGGGGGDNYTVTVSPASISLVPGASQDFTAVLKNNGTVVEVRPEDVSGNGGLPGLAFREELEHTAYRMANTNTDASGHRSFCSQAPAQRLTDFLARRSSRSLPRSSYTPGIVSSRLDAWLPPFIAERLQLAFPEFEKKMHGFICPEALLIAPETRTSTPVRITRTAETYESPVISGLFPAGEGSGYAGGIVSSALDGENTAKAITKRRSGAAS